MPALLAILGNLGPIMQLAMMAVQAVQQLAPSAPVAVTNDQKKTAAVTAITDAIKAAAPVSAQMMEVHTAIQSQDSAQVGAAIGHSVELALSICKTFGIFSKAGIVQAAPELPQQPSNG